MPSRATVDGCRRSWTPAPPRSPVATRAARPASTTSSPAGDAAGTTLGSRDRSSGSGTASRGRALRRGRRARPRRVGGVVSSVTRTQVVYPRSAAKPVQAAGMLRARAATCRTSCWRWSCRLPPGRAAARRGRSAGSSAASGSTSRRCRARRSCPATDAERPRGRACGGRRPPSTPTARASTPAMLATCVVNGWPTDDYLEPRPPAAAGAARPSSRTATGERVAHTGVDGCGAPIWACRWRRWPGRSGPLRHRAGRDTPAARGRPLTRCGAAPPSW